MRSFKMLPAIAVTGLIAHCALACAGAQVSSAANRRDILLQSKLVTVRYHRQTGEMDILWRDGHKLFGLTSGAQLEDGRSLSTSVSAEHDLEPSADGSAHEYTIRSTQRGVPVFLQHIWLYDNKPWIEIECELGSDAGAIGTRHFDAVVLKGTSLLQVDKSAALRVLHVPFDNDMWFRYESKPVSDLKPNETFSSDEVTAIYDNDSRHAIVLGSITHSVWKTAIDIRAEENHISALDVYGGISSPNGVRSDTHDTVPHGIVHGAHVVSPRIFIGSFSDWRDGLEAYGEANAAVQPPLQWAGGVPIGWNSWAAYGEKVNYRRYLGAGAFVRDSLVPRGFGRDKVVYINLDAFWSNLDAVQLADAVANIKAMHGVDGTRFEPGIYWTPFAYWSDDLDAYVEGTDMKYRYRDILLKAPDGTFLPKVDGGRPIDPSHPGAKARASYFLKQFQQLGFTYLKLDFLSHGALEGAHYDSTIQTGIEAYNEGMKQIVDEAGSRMFLSLSIAPLFPSGYGHARRLSCDTKGHIGGGDQSTEYMLNSLTYGWWTNKRLYIADPDHVVLGEKADLGARSVEEGKSRLLSALIASGMILDSSRLADDDQGRALAQKVYDNHNLFAVADQGEAFRPIEGDTGDKAATAFIRRSPHGVYLAVFNYEDKQPQTITVSLGRIDPSFAAVPAVTITDVATGKLQGSAHSVISIQLQPAQSKLLELRPEKP